MNTSKLFRILLAVGALLWGMRLAVAADPSRIVAFGDSLSDPGNAFVLVKQVERAPFDLIPDAPYGRGGLHFSDGETWVEQLGRELRLAVSTGAALRAPSAASNYAVGGSRARLDGTTSLGVQVGWFLSQVGGAAPGDALYIVYFGGNDIRDALTALGADPSGASSAAILNAAVLAIRDNLLALYGAGARDFLVPNAPNLGLVPAVRLLGPQAQGAAQLLSTNFNAGLELVLSGLEASLPIRITRLDVFAIIADAAAAPASVGFVDAVNSCITPGVLVGAVCARPDEFLFWDGIHPTRAGHQLLSRRALQALQP